MGTESPSLTAQRRVPLTVPELNHNNIPRKHNKFSHLAENKQYKKHPNKLWCAAEICKTVNSDSSASHNRCLKLACLWESTFPDSSHNTFFLT